MLYIYIGATLIALALTYAVYLIGVDLCDYTLSTYECWTNSDGTTVSFGPKGTVPLDWEWEEDPTWHCLYTVKARSWTEAMTIHHQKQGFEPYVPFDDDEECDG